MTASAPARRILRIRGTVQGVGFRPFVYRTALALGLTGSVWNDADGVVIDAEGPPASLDALARALAESSPPRAIVEGITIDSAVPDGAASFVIRGSDDRAPSSARVSPDLATCAACLAEMRNPSDRRHRYPFINCTDCGPRFSIVRDVPYDRSRTTMSAFSMCGPCQAEYDDPSSRRFHAQPNACPTCGPKVFLAGSGETDAVETALSALRGGAIVAVKGLGGFHLACDARDPLAVARLRDRKRRPDKPFAVMFPDMPGIEREAFISAEEREALLGARRPIVLLARRPESALPDELAPRLSEIGAFLPYTPLQELLLHGFAGPLVMTSGNLTEEPIAAGNDEALRTLDGIADLFLLHDRDIHMRADDSVVHVLMGKERVLRRARGHVPEAIDLGFPTGGEVLAVGADLKNTFCLTSGGAAILSQHIGDLENYESQLFLAEARENLERLFRVRPAMVAHDLHPGYHSTALARKTGLPMFRVQHHHAHIASCLADNGRRDRVIGVAWDGTGYGTDGSVWGGEFLVADFSGFERVGRIRPVALAGGDAAVREPWRMALAHLVEAGLETDRIVQTHRREVESMIRSGIGTVPTSSAGRLFDAVSSLAGLRHEASYEGQAAVELEAASASDGLEPYAFPVTEGPVLELDAGPLVREILADLEKGVSVPVVGGRFHLALAAAIADACARIRVRTGLHTVALSGGCFHSRLLTRLAKERLEAAGFEVLLHSRVPAGDGGISLGQAAVAAWWLQRPSTRGD